MFCHVKKIICGQCINQDEIQQQISCNTHYLNQGRQRNSGKELRGSSKKGKHVYSFKNQSFRTQDTPARAYIRSIDFVRKAEDVGQKVLQTKKSNKQNVHYSRSPQVKFSYSPQPITRMYKHSAMPAKVFVSDKAPECIFNREVPLISKMSGKRIKTAQQETQYSSKQSQIHVKFSPESTEATNFFQTKTNNFKKKSNPIIFQQEGQQSLNTTHYNGLDLDQNMKTFASRQYIPPNNHPPVQSFVLNNNHNFQTIVTSTEIKSRQASQINNQLPYLKFIKESPYKQQSQRFNPLERQVQSIPNSLRQKYKSPSKIVSIFDYSNIDSNMLYSSKQQSSDYQKISVLNINQMENSKQRGCLKQQKGGHAKISALNSIQQSQTSQNLIEQQLRDVINDTLAQSSLNENNRFISPFVSHQPSLINICNDDKRSKYVSFKAISPVHSRDSSREFVLFAKTRANLGRTNTIQSMQSHYSEKSCLDIKFMQKLRSRRGVSKLI